MRKKTPARAPHPDPAMELELTRILDLRASVSRRASLIDVYRQEIERLHGRSRRATYDADAQRYWKQAGELGVLITAEEAAIAATGEQISALRAQLSPDDLAYLGV